MKIDEQIFDVIKILLSAFAGALFAFIFLKFAERGRDKKEKRKANIKALSKIQQICNENYNLLNSTLYSINEILKVIEEARKRNQSPFSANRLDTLVIDKDILLDLLNNDFVNDYFSYMIMIKKQNDDVEATNNFHESMKMARLTDKITPENYIQNMIRFEDNLKVEKKFINDSMKQTEMIVAKCRVLLKEKTSIYRKIFKYKNIGYDRKFNEKYNKELKLLRAEMDTIKKKSKEEIENILKAK